MGTVRHALRHPTCTHTRRHNTSQSRISGLQAWCLATSPLTTLPLPLSRLTQFNHHEAHGMSGMRAEMMHPAFLGRNPSGETPQAKCSSAKQAIL